MALSSLALVGADSTLAPKLVKYALRSQNGNVVDYVGIDSSSTLAAPELISVKFDIKQPGVRGNDRIHGTLRKVVLDSENLPHTGSVTVQVSIPRDPSWSPAETVSLLKQAADYFAGCSAVVAGSTDTSGFPAEWSKILFP